MKTRTPLERVSDNKGHQMYLSQPHIRLNNAEFSENDSNLSDEECKSLNASQSNIGTYLLFTLTGDFSNLYIA